jgi:hypothetical protein
MLLDANVLLHAVHERSEQHEQAAEWLTEKMNGTRRVGFPWQSLSAFIRIATHPRAFARPLEPRIAWDRVTDWLNAPPAWVPEPGPGYTQVFGGLIRTYEVRGNLVPDAALAALAIEHGLVLISTDTDFGRFRELQWDNPFR